MPAITMFGWWWLDPIAALVVAVVATKEGLETRRGLLRRARAEPAFGRLRRRLLRRASLTDPEGVRSVAPRRWA
jgi:Co/Zn/Cd efflux system component